MQARVVGTALLVASLTCGAVDPSRAVVGDEHRQYDVDLLRPVLPAGKAAASIHQELEASPAWRSWRNTFPGWRADWNLDSRTVHRAWGPGVRIAATTPSALDIEDQCRAFLAGTSDWSGIDASGLRLVQAQRHMDRWYVIFEQMHEDLPVVSGRVDLRVAADGSLLLVGADWIDAPLGNTRRVLDPAATLRAAQRDFTRPTSAPTSQRSVLAAVPGPQGRTLRLADELVFRTEDPPGLWRCLVDVENGVLLQRENQLRFANVVGNISATVEPDSPFDLPQTEPLPQTRLNVGSGLTEYGFTDAAGDFSVPTTAVDSVNVFVRLAGSLARVYNDELGRSTPRIDAKVLPGSPRDFLWDDSNSRASERDAYAHTLEAHGWIKQLDPSFTGVDYIMPVVVDIGGRECNAWWDGWGINFLQAGPRCVNTARIADVVYHEYGHGITDWQYRPFAPSGAMHEGFSDYMAASMRNDPVIGRDFYGPGTSIRTVDNTLLAPDDLTGEVHHDGLILAGALWDLRTAIGAARTDSLFHFARYGLATNYDDYMLDVLVTDDDNGNIFDGTPHFDAIVQAFSTHGIGDYSVQIAHDALPDTEDDSKSLVLDATILSLFPLDPASLLVMVRVDEGPWSALPLQSAAGIRAFTATLPMPGAGTMIDYWIVAADTQGHAARWPVPDPGWHRLLVGPDTIPPEVSAIPLADRPMDAPGWRLRATVHDNLDRDLADVTALWSRGAPDLGQNVALTRRQGDVWEGVLPTGGAALGDVVHYALVATDSASTPNVTRLPDTGTWSFRVVQGFLRDFEADNGGLSASGEWQWGIPTLGPETAWSGDHAWATGLDTGYSNDVHSILSLPAVDLGTWSRAALHFQHWFAFEDYYDGARVEISTDNGVHWQLLVPDGGYDWEYVDVFAGPAWSGDSTGWQTASFDLSRYRGLNVLLRLHFASDGGVTDIGWVVDDVEVVEHQVLATPLHLRAQDGFDTQVPLRWDPPAGIDPEQGDTPLLGYHVHRASQQDLSDAVRLTVTPLPQPEWIDTGLVNGTPYWYAVSAVYAEGDSPLGAPDQALPYRAVAAPQAASLVVEAMAGAGVDTSVTFANAGTGFLRCNAWLGDPGQSLDDVRIAWDLAAPPTATANRVVRESQVPSYTIVFEDAQEGSSPVDLHRFAVAQEGQQLDFKVTGWVPWQNILTDFTVVISIDSDADRGTGDAEGADHYVLVGAFPMQAVGVPAFVSNTDEVVLGVASYVVVPTQSDSMEVGFDLGLLGPDVGRMFLRVTAFSADLSAPFDDLPNAADAAAWVTLDDRALSVTPAQPQALAFSLASGLSPAAYHAALLLETNDPDAFAVTLPLEFRSGVTPVVLQDLVATRDQAGVLLSWRTALEQGVAAYRVFRSRDGGTLEAVPPDVAPVSEHRYVFRDAQVPPGTWTYRIGEVTHAGDVTLHGQVEVTVERFLPRQAFLDRNVPNPFNPNTRLAFGVDRTGPVSLQVFDARGRLVRTLVRDPALQAGLHEVVWDGRDDQGRRVASGVYHAQLVVNGRPMTRRMTLMK